MPVESIANLFRNLSDQLLGLTQGSSVQKSLLGIATPVTAAVAEDTFTPSTQNGPPQPPAQEAGLFQFALGTLTANQTGLPSQPAPGVHEISGAQQAAATAKAGANGISGQPETNPPATQATTSAASAAANIQLQIQSLNAALPALGLTNTEINQIDRIASLVTISLVSLKRWHKRWDHQRPQALRYFRAQVPRPTLLPQKVEPVIRCRKFRLNLRHLHSREIAVLPVAVEKTPMEIVCNQIPRDCNSGKSKLRWSTAMGKLCKS
jgi:hypothetical protein